MAIDLLAGAALAPVLIGQAMTVRSRVRMLPEPQGARQGRKGQGPLLRLLVIGDSSAAGVGAPSQDDALLGQVVARLSQNWTVDYLLLAQSGGRTRDALAWLDGADLRCDVAITALGVNDVTKGTSLRRFLRAQQDLHDRLHQRHGARQIIVSAVPPVGLFPALPQPLRWVLGQRAARFDRALRNQLAGRSQCHCVPFDGEFRDGVMAPDGFHPSPRTYAIWADRLVSRITATPTAA